MYAIGYDLGSSSIKASIVDISSGQVIASGKYPEHEMSISAPNLGWAEQNPEMWWEYTCVLTLQLLQLFPIEVSKIESIGISYQMHGLVLVDKDYKVLRPSIIWCDSRAADIGEQAFRSMGREYCLAHLLNSPGNFTASKLKWVMENEPEIYDKIYKWMLPGDFIAMKLTGEIATTISGLSEGMFWDFKNHNISQRLMDEYGFDKEKTPKIVDTFSIQGFVTEKASRECGLNVGIPVTYRAGDQPNNALSLKAFLPGDVAATGGTSGVIYGVTDSLLSDPQSRVNGFAHVNHSKNHNRIGQLLCINGCGILYAWLRRTLGKSELSYDQMENEIKNVPIGSNGLRILPFGNGSERILNDQMTGASILNLQFNVHTYAHLFRAGLEGIAFSFTYGIEILKTTGLEPKTIRVGNDNLFLSEVFSTTMANLLQCDIEMYETTGAVGAAKASMVATGVHKNIESAISDMKPIKIFKHQENNSEILEIYASWMTYLKHNI